MPTSCPDCPTLTPETAGFCPGCGRPMRRVERAPGTVGDLPETLAGALAYFLLPAIFFLLVEPYQKNQFTRFHSIQCIVYCLVGSAVLLLFFAAISPPLVMLISLLVGFGFFVVWAVLVVKALQGEMLLLPLVGTFAARQCSTE